MKPKDKESTPRKILIHYGQGEHGEKEIHAITTMHLLLPQKAGNSSIRKIGQQHTPWHGVPAMIENDSDAENLC